MFLQAIARYCNDKTSPEYEALFLASEVIADINQLCNHCLRDKQNLDIIRYIDKAMVNMNMVSD